MSKMQSSRLSTAPPFLPLFDDFDDDEDSNEYN